MIDYPRGIPVLIFILVTGITVLSVFAIERGEKQRDAADVARKAQAMTSAIERRAYTSSAYLRAGAALLRAVAACPGSAAVAAGDAPAWAATRRAAYRELLRAGGALDELLEACSACEARDADAGARARGLLDAELAGTMLRGAFAGVPPVAFAKHIADVRHAAGSSRCGAGASPFRFVREWLSRRDWPAEDEERAGAGGEKNENAWRLEDALADAGVCAAPPPASAAAPSPAARAPSKRKRVEV